MLQRVQAEVREPRDVAARCADSEDPAHQTTPSSTWSGQPDGSPATITPGPSGSAKPTGVPLHAAASATEPSVASVKLCAFCQRWRTSSAPPPRKKKTRSPARHL